MPVIVHCPSTSSLHPPTYIYGHVVYTRKHGATSPTLYTVNVTAEGKLDDPIWQEVKTNRYVVARDDGMDLPHCYYKVFEYVGEGVEPTKPVEPPKPKTEPVYVGQSLERINKHLRELAKRKEKTGYTDDYRLGILEKEWDE